MKPVVTSLHLPLVIGLALCLAACSKPAAEASADTAATPAAASSAPAEAAPAAGTAAAAQPATFDPSTLPVTTGTLGAFPYIAPPEGYRFNGKNEYPLDSFMFAIEGRPVTLEGKLFRAPLTSTTYGNESKLAVEKHFLSAMQALGARELNNSEIDFKLYEDANYNTERSDVNIGQVTHTWGVKTPDGKPVIFQLGLNGISYHVMEMEAAAP